MSAPASRSGGRGAPHVGPKGPLREQLEAAVKALAVPEVAGEPVTWVVDAWSVDGRHAGYVWWLGTDGHDRRVMFHGLPSGEALGRALLSGLALVEGGAR